MSVPIPDGMEEVLRDERAGDDAAIIDSSDRNVRAHQREFLVNLPDFGVRLHDIDGTETVTVHTVPDGFYIEL